VAAQRELKKKSGCEIITFKIIILRYALMKHKKSIIELIKTRSSWRKYAPQEIAGKMKRNILEQIAAPLVGPFGNRVEFRLIEKKISEKEEQVRLGTYGFISGAKHFIVGAVKDSEKNFEDYGYLLEKLILYFTGLGLATCWLGGSFKRKDFGKTLELTEEKIIPAITPVGYPAKRRGIRDSFIRMTAGSKSRKPWEELFFEEQAGQYEIPLQMVRLAPSASNKQPWRILRQENMHRFFLRRTKNYDKMIKVADMQRIDMGIAMYHFESTARELNLPGKWQIEDIKDFDIKFDDPVEYIVSWLAD
jgi:nitroreductase